MASRLFFHEAFCNQKCGKKLYFVFLFILDSLLIALGAWQMNNVFSHSDDFYYDPDTKEGSETCFQNRIVFVAEVAIIAFTFMKDIYFACCAKEEEKAVIEPEGQKRQL